MSFLTVLVAGCLLVPADFSSLVQEKTPPQEKAAPKPARKKKPQEPDRPYPYLDEEVSYQNKSAGIILAGTFTAAPKKAGRLPRFCSSRVRANRTAMRPSWATSLFWCWPIS